MKTVLFFLLFPAFAFGQTIHVKDKKIVYEGKEDLGRRTNPVTEDQLERMLGIEGQHPAAELQEKSVAVHGRMKLKTPYPILRYVNYRFKLTPLDSGYKYVIDSVYYTEQERGRKIDTLSSEKMVNRMDETGAIVGETEKILNETDMRFEKLIAVLRSEMKKS